MPFHRNSANPAGYAAFPSGYDFINNPSANGDPGAPALFDIKKSGGPNAGTYLFAFGDDILAQFINRGQNALADNCDVLDNYARRPIAVPTTSTVFVAGVSGDTQIALPASPAVYLGTSGQDTEAESAPTLFTVTDEFGDPIIIQSTGVQVVAASITSTNGGDAIGSGFALGTITVVFNRTIPAGKRYKIYYGVKSSTAFMPPDSLLLSVQQTPLQGFMADFILQVSNPGVPGANVTGLVSYAFRTPSGVRLAKSNSMSFDVDPTDSGSTVRFFQWTSRADVGGARVVAQMFDDPTQSQIPGSTGRLQVAAGLAHVSLGTHMFRDANIATGAPGGNIFGLIPLSSTVTANGDQFIRIGDSLPTSATPSTYPESILQSLNARFEIVVGDGVSTFGDFNGPTALEDAVVFFQASNQPTGHIKVKSGSYTWATSHTLAGPQSLFIEGAGSTSTSVSVTSASSDPALSLNFLFGMKGISWVQGGSNIIGFLNTGGLTFLEDVVLETLVYLSQNAQSPFFPAVIGPCFYAKRCSFIATNAQTPGCILEANDGNTHDGYIFEDCTFNASVLEAKTVIVGGATPAAGTTLSGIRFIRTTFQLAATVVTGGAQATNTGVLEVVVDTQQTLTIADITFDNCTVTAGNAAIAGTASVLAYIMPVPYGATGFTALAVIEKVTIKGGKWDAGSSASALSPMFICAQKVVVDDVDLMGTAAACTGAPPPEAKFALTFAGTPVATADWGTFTFSVGATLQFNVPGSVEFATDFGISCTNVRFSKLQQFGCGDLRVDLPGRLTTEIAHVSSRLQNLKFFDYRAATAAGTVPNYRFNIGNTVVVGDGSVNAVIDQAAFQGTQGGESAGWSALGIVGIQPTIDLHLRVVNVHSFLPASGPAVDNGFYIHYGAGIDAYDITLEDCRANGLLNGLVIPSGSGSNNAVDGFRVIGGDYSNNHQGIVVTADRLGEITFHRVRACYNTQQGILIGPGAWSLVPPSGGASSHLTITDGTFIGNFEGSGSKTQISVETSNSGDFVYGSIRGNLCRSTAGGFGSIEIQQGAGGAMTTPASPGVSSFVRGVETGWATTPQLTYTNAIPMIHNDALLQTP